MGFRYRKSINLGGGFKINISKSGIGYSWGVPRYRITKTSKGTTRKTYSIPGTGISYVNENGRKRNSQKSTIKLCNPSNSQIHDVMQDIDSAPIGQLQSAEYQELIDKLSKILKINRLSNILLWFVLLMAQPLFILLPITGIVLKILLHTKWKVNIDYTISEEIENEYKNRISAWTNLNNCGRLWQIIQFANVSNTKTNAGASRNINRVIFKFLQKTPFYLSTNVTAIQMKLKNETLILLPDKILIIRETRIGTVNYDSLYIDVGTVNFVESQSVPNDAHIVNYTWLYVNKNGGPDKRFKNNRQLPVCLYGRIIIKSPEGINIEFQCSNPNISNTFKEKIEEI